MRLLSKKTMPRWWHYKRPARPRFIGCPMRKSWSGAKPCCRYRSRRKKESARTGSLPSIAKLRQWRESEPAMARSHQFVAELNWCWHSHLRRRYFCCLNRFSVVALTHLYLFAGLKIWPQTHVVKGCFPFGKVCGEGIFICAKKYFECVETAGTVRFRQE